METSLTRKNIVRILTETEKTVFEQYKYNPNRAIAFYEGKVNHIYFIAETKDSMSSMQLREIYKSKIHCAKEHFKAINSDNVIYDAIDSY